jgi:hypothetical protein
MFGNIDFLANCGGLLGLFMGVSFLSILEIFYSCTVRLYYNLKKYRKQQQTKLVVKSVAWVKPAQNM